MTGSQRGDDLRRDSSAVVGWVYARESSADLARQTREWLRDDHGELARDLIEQNMNRTPEQRAGHYFEFMESTGFNVSAAGADSTLRATMTAAEGQPADAADVVITSSQEVLREVQAKAYSSSADAARALSDERYAGMQRLVPTDQEPEVQARLASLLEGTPEIILSSHYEDVAANLTGQLEHGDVASGGTSRDELREVAQGPESSLLEWLSDNSTAAELHELLAMAGGGTMVGGAFGLVAGTIQGRMTAEGREQSPVRTVVDITKSSVTTAVRTGSVGSFGQVIRAAARRSDTFVGFSESLGPVAIANSALEIGSAGFGLARGDCTVEQFCQRSAGAAMRNSTMWAFGFAGQTLLPIPVAGALVGGAMGYATATAVQAGLKLATAAAREADVAVTRLEELELWIYDAIACLEEQRRFIELTTELHTSHMQQQILPTLDHLERSLIAGHEAQAFETLVALNRLLGFHLEWSTPEGFDRWMYSEQPLIL